jgi:hypothetical protein
MKNISEFLSFIQGSTKDTIIRIPTISASGETTGFWSRTMDQISRYNGQTDIYYIPNVGGTTDAEINRLTCAFIDLDCGRDRDKNYHPIHVVEKYKSRKLFEVQEFDLPPSVIVETRNGLQVYWVFSDSPDVSRWRNIIRKLIVRFDSDASVRKPCQLMRLPFTTWLKPQERLDPFNVTIQGGTYCKYEAQLLEDALVDVEIAGLDHAGRQIGIYLPTHTNYGNAQLIAERNIEALHASLDAPQRTFDTYSDLRQYITCEIDLRQFLGVEGTKTRCIFHEDQKPSAGIFITKNKEHYYKCHSNSCGAMGNIVRCVQLLQGCSYAAAIKFIKSVFRLRLESDWQLGERARLDRNRYFIEYELPEKYRVLYKNIKNDIHVLNTLIDIAHEHVQREEYADADGNAVFFVSQRHLAELLGVRDHKSVGKRISRLCFHRLLRKLPEEEVPPALLARAQKLRDANGAKQLISFYTVTSYTGASLSEILDRARIANERPMPLSGVSYETFVRTFGPDVANEVFPQIRNKQLSPESDDRTTSIHEIAMSLIMDRGYALEKEILDQFSFANPVVRSIVKSQYNRSLYEMLDSYDIQRVRLTKKLKSELRVQVRGYPYVIIRRCC